jgi:GrpB-like predicted nucleotidyltransferase (UPF0157 family)
MEARGPQDVVVVEYDPTWPAQFNRERARIRAALAGSEPPVVAIEHVGSTAVPGMASKAIVDILVGTAGPVPFERFVPPLEMLGYEFIGMPQFTESSFLRRGPWRHATHHLHVTALGSAFWRDTLLFRDTLRASPGLAAEYVALKRRLAAQFPHDRPSYTQGKSEFIAAVLASARARQPLDAV